MNPVICKSEGVFQFSCFLVLSQQRKHRKSFHCQGKYFAKENFVHPYGLWWNVIAGTKWEFRVNSIVPSCPLG